MRYYQPVLSDEEWETGELASFEVYHYLENAKKDYPKHQIAVYEDDDIGEPTFVDVLKTRIRILHDSSPMNPFEDWDCEYPLMYSSGNGDADFSKGDIDNFLSGFLTGNQLRRHMNRILDLVEFSREDFDLDYPLTDYTGDERLDILQDMLDEFITDSIENRAAFCEEFGIKYYNGGSRGYSQGDYADVFVCWTPEFGKTAGVEYKDITEDRLKSSFDLFTQWAWGDVYGFIVEEEETGDHLDSCWGFYGSDWANNGVMDYIMDCIEDKTEEEILEILEDIEVEPGY